MRSRPPKKKTMKTDIHAPSDVPGASSRKTMPREARASLCTLVDEAPEGDQWIHEKKYDGYRIIAYLDRGEVVLQTRNGKDWTDRFKGLAEKLSQWPTCAVLDGEVCALDKKGLSSFQKLQGAMREDADAKLIYFAFDLLWWDGQDLRDADLQHRKTALRELFDQCHAAPSRGPVRFADHESGDGPKQLTKACREGLEGIICKKRESRYRGTRTRDWLKVKCSRRQEFVIGGFTEPSGSRVGFGSLLLGVYDEDGNFRYSGRIGTGFDDSLLEELRAKLDRLSRKTPPFENPPDGRDAKEVTWVTPSLVAEVSFTEWTDDGRLRHPAFQGLRQDKEAKEVRREHH